MVERRDVELLIRAKDLSSKPLRDVAAALDQISTSLSSQVEAARRGEASYQELASAFQQVQQAGKALAAQQGLIDRFNKLNEASGKVAANLKTAEDALQAYRATVDASGTATKKQESELRKLEAAYARAEKAFNTNAGSLDAVRQRLTEAGVDTRDLAAAQQQIVTSATQAGQAATTLSTAMAGYAKNAREAARANQATAQLEGFRKLATDADASVAAAQRLASATGSTRASASDFANSLRAIADPAAEARRTLDGLEDQVRELSQTVAAVNGPVKNYEQTLLQLSAAQRSAVQTGRLVDSFRDQSDAVLRARQAFVAARAEVRNYQQQIASAAAPSDDLRRKLDAAEKALAASAKNFRDLANKARESRDALRDAGVDTRNLDDAQKRLTATVRTSTEATSRLNAAFAQFGSGGSGGAGIFGLSPYAVQNLGFQINDFFTQIASGTSVTQAFAQQGGQVVQVFGPGAWSAVARWIPMIGSLAAAFIVAASALSRLNQESSSNRNFAANLTLLGAGPNAGVTPQQLTAVAREIERLGLSFDDARKAALLFLREGLAPANIAAATEAAARLSRVLGIDVVEAVRLVNSAARGSTEGFAKLREAGVSFSDEQQAALTAARSLSSEFERQQAILAILAQRFREADEQGLGPWQRAVIGAQNVWRGFLDELGRTTVFQTIKSALDGLANSLSNLRSIGQIAARSLIGAFLPFVNVIDSIVTQLRRLGVLSPAQGAAAAAQTPAEPDRPTGQSPVGGATEGEIRAQSEATRRELELIRDDERRTRREREAAARRLFQIEVDGANEGATAQTRAYLVQLRLLEFRKRLDDEAERTGREGAAATRRDFQAIQQDIQNTVRVRDEAIRGIQEDVAAGALTPAQAIERIQAAADQARPALQRLAEEARRFRDQNRGGDAVRSAALDSLVAQAERQAGSAGTRQGVTQVISTQQQEVERLVQQRQQFVQTQNALQQQGVVSVTESEDRIRDFYAQTNDELVRQIDLLQQAAEAARGLGPSGEAAFQQVSAAVELYRANLQRIDPEVARLRNSIEQGFVSSITTAINTAAEAFGNFLAGVSTLEEAFQSAGQAVLQFFADFLKAIAQAIIQQQALIAVKLISKAIGAFHSGGVVGNKTPNLTRNVSPAWFAGAPRYHSGGVVGLAPNEVPAILQKGEEVLTRDDPRNVLNGGGRSSGGGGPAAAIRNVLVVGERQIADAMNSAPGEQVMLNFLKKNAPTVRQIIR